MLYIASDHAGFKLKSKIKEYLSSRGVEVVDMGPAGFYPEDDYPDYVIPAVRRFQEDGEGGGGGAILICRNGVGVSMLANRFKGIRASLSWSPRHAMSSRTDDNTNVLALPADYIDEKTATDIVDAWLNADFGNEERHVRRLKKVERAN